MSLPKGFAGGLTGESLALPAKIARKVRALAKSRKVSERSVLLDLIQRGLRTEDSDKKTFLALADAFVNARDPKVRRLLKGELARRTFGC